MPSPGILRPPQRACAQDPGSRRWRGHERTRTSPHRPCSPVRGLAPLFQVSEEGPRLTSLFLPVSGAPNPAFLQAQADLSRGLLGRPLRPVLPALA